MSSVQNIEQWNEAVQLFENGKFSESIQRFGKIADSSKILFNIGVAFQFLEKHEQAVLEFSKAIKRDPYFSAAYFLRGISQHLIGQFEDSINSFCDAVDHMRGNDEIDYTQLGFAYQLYACEIFYNCGLSYAKLGDEATAMEVLQNASSTKQLPDHNVIDDAIRARCRGFDLFQLPPNLIFKPPVSKLEGIKKIDFSGSAKVIAAIRSEDNFIEFKGFRALALNSPDAGPSSDLPKSKLSLYRIKPLASQSLPRRPSAESPLKSPSTPKHQSIPLRTSDLSERSSSLNPRRASNESNMSSPDRPRRPSRPPLSPISVISNKSTDSGRKLSGNPLPPPRRPSAPPPIFTDSFLPSPSQMDSPQSVQDKLRVKINFGEKRLIMFPYSVTFDQLYSKIQQKFNADSFNIVFKDEEGEWLALRDDDDLAVAIELSSETGKLEIWCS